MRDLLHRREQILHYRAAAEIDFGRDNHAGRDPELFAIAFEVRRIQPHQRSKASRWHFVLVRVLAVALA